MPFKYLFFWSLITLPLLINESALILNIGIISSILFLANICTLAYKRNVRLNFFSLLSISLLVGYGLGSFISIFTANEIVNNSKNIHKYSYTLWFVISTCLLLVSFSKLYPSIDILKYKYANRESFIVNKNFYLVIIILTIIKYYLFGFGVNNQGSGSVSIIPLILTYLLIITPALIIDDLLHYSSNKRFLILLLLMAVTLLIPLGRRAVIYSLMLGLVWSSYALSMIKLKKSQLYFSFFFVVIFIIISNYFFIAMRVSGEFNNSNVVTSIDKISGASELINKSGLEDVNEYLRSQNSDRAFILRFLSELVEAESKSTPLFGKETIESIKIIIPSFIGIKKFQGDIENIAQRHFKMKITDEANSVLTTAIADYGTLGIFFLPLIVATLYQIVLTIIFKINNAPLLARKISSLIIIFGILNSEITIGGYLSLLRDSILILIVVSISIKIFMSIGQLVRKNHSHII